MAGDLTLERILHRQGFGTRKKCRSLIAQGEVMVNGQLCNEPHAVFATAGLHLTVAGEGWAYHEQAYLMLNKPKHFECSHKPQHHPAVYALLPSLLIERGVQAVGRLDEDTTGLLLFSDDGQFIHRMSSPKHKVPKVYVATLKHPIDEAMLAALTAGVQLADEDCLVIADAAIALDSHRIQLTISEGKYHQVKRMIAAVSNRVEQLHRSQIGGLGLPDDLPERAWRWLSADDLAVLWAARPDP
jgi:16S rRNA pseudouridine516 synthase